MTLNLQTFNNGDTNYVAKHNANAAAIETQFNAMEQTLTASFGATVSVGAAFLALFGPLPAVIGETSYKATGSGSTLTVQPGFSWSPSTGMLTRSLAPATINFSSLSAATYYIYADATGAPQQRTDPSDALYSVVWTGSAFGAITRVANLVWSSPDWTDAQTSTALGGSYEGLDARLEAGETITKANQTAIATYGTGATLTKDTDGTLAANSDTRVATQRAVKAYVDANIGGLTDAMVLKGVIDCSANPNYPAANAGDVYKVSVAGKIGGASGPNVEVGDSLYCITDGSSAGTHAAVGANWVIFQANIDIDTDGTLAANSDAKVASQKAVKTYIDAHTGGAQPFDVLAFYPGIPTASAKVCRVPIARAVTFAANFAGSYFTASANATGTTVFDVQKNGSSIGSVSIAAGGTTATFTTTGGTSKSFAAGDVLALIAPGTPDATLADVGFTLAGTR